MKIQSRVLFFLFAFTIIAIAIPAVAEDTSSGHGDVEVLEAKTAGDVEDREAIDVSTSFTQGDRVTVWMAIKNSESPTHVDVVWKSDGSEVHALKLDVGESTRWRTWANMTVHQSGDWSVEIRSPDGQVLKTVDFTVSESS